MKIDPACYADGDGFPDKLRKGARVRLTGGTLECGVPTGPLKNRRWKVGTAENVGLSDRMEYRKDLDDKGAVELVFRKFKDPETETKTVYLKPDEDGIVRITRQQRSVRGRSAAGQQARSIPVRRCVISRRIRCCSIRPARTSRIALTSADRRCPLDGGGPMIVSEGNTACCPCGGDGDPQIRSPETRDRIMCSNQAFHTHQASRGDAAVTTVRRSRAQDERRAVADVPAVRRHDRDAAGRR